MHSTKILTRDKETEAWEAIQQFRASYEHSKDPVKLSAVEWVRRDRKNH